MGIKQTENSSDNGQGSNSVKNKIPGEEKIILLNINSKVEDLKVQNMENAKFLRGISRKIESELYQMRELEENRSAETYDGSSILESIERVEKSVNDINNNEILEAIEKVNSSIQKIEKTGSTEQAEADITGEIKKINEVIEGIQGTLNEIDIDALTKEVERLNEYAGKVQSVTDKLTASADETAKNLNSSADGVAEKLDSSTNEAKNAAEQLNVSLNHTQETVSQLQDTVKQTDESAAKLNEAIDNAGALVTKIDEAATQAEGAAQSLDKAITESVAGSVDKINTSVSRFEDLAEQINETAKRIDTEALVNEISILNERVQSLNESKNVLDGIVKTDAQQSDFDSSAVLDEIRNIQTTIGQIDQSEVLNELRRIKRFLAGSKTDNAAAMNALNDSINRLNLASYENTLEELRKMLKVSEEKSDELGKKIDRVASMPTMVKSVLDRVNAENLSRIEEIIADSNAKKADSIRKMMNINLWATLLTLVILIARILGIV